MEDAVMEIKKVTNGVERAFNFAQRLAARGDGIVTTGHLLAGISNLTGCHAAKVLTTLGVDQMSLDRAVLEQIALPESIFCDTEANLPIIDGEKPVGEPVPTFVQIATGVWKFAATTTATTDVADQLGIAIVGLRRQSTHARLKFEFLKVGEGVWLAYIG